MNDQWTCAAALLAACAISLCAVAGADHEQALEAEARSLAAEFAGRLKPELQAALRDGGPVHAIGVCADKAPAIADALSVESGWLVKRVSLKARNASRAIPDRWETAVLEALEQRREAGEPATALSYSETTPSHYRYMQAQVVEGVCLTCHGKALSAEVSRALHEYYPDDRATAYNPGQVRGAISLSKPLRGSPE